MKKKLVQFFANSQAVTALFLGHHNCFVPKIILVIGISMIAALMEGSAFGLLMLALGVIAPSGITLIKVPFIDHLNEGMLFTSLVLGGIAMQGLKSFISYINSQITTNLALNMQTDAQLHIYQHILNFDFKTINQYKVGELTALIRSPTELFQPYLSCLKELILNVFIILTYLALMMNLSFYLTILSLSFTLGILYIQKKCMGFINAESTKISIAVQNLSTQTTEYFNGIRTLFIFNRQSHTIKNAKTNLEKVAGYSKSMYRWINSASAINEFLSIMLVGSLLIIAYFVLNKNNNATLPLITAFMGIAYRLATRLPVINGTLSSLSAKKGECVVLAKLLSHEGKSFHDTQGTSFTSFNHSIDFKQLSFAYPQTHSLILNHISFSIKKSNITAIVGHSGAGKSTLIDLLAGLYTPTEGSILIDGVDLQTYTADSWRSHLGIVSQDVFIFNSSIIDNIRYGKLEASDDEVIFAAKQAGAHKFIIALKEGYNTLVGEKGYTLSGGEKQRLSLARTLLRNPEILILDEATSNLDSESERIIQDSINEFHHKKTLIIIAHRLSTIKKADQILVLDQGAIIEQGSHFSLLELEGKYSKFWNLQTLHT